MKGVVALVAIGLMLGSSGAANAQDATFTGRWSFSGLIVAGPMSFAFAQVCDIQQIGPQVAGSCHGPNGACSAVGVANGPNLDLTCRTVATNNPAIAGVLTFHGAVAPDGVVRGSCTHTATPGVGQSALMRI
jgi:hypothetical protein